MSKTAENLIDEVAGILGKNVPGEALSAIDHDVIDAAIDPVLAELTKIVAVYDRDDIPDEYFMSIARIVALHSASKFSNGSVDYDSVARHENRLRYLVAQSPTYEVMKTVYY